MSSISSTEKVLGDSFENVPLIKEHPNYDVSYPQTLIARSKRGLCDRLVYQVTRPIFLAALYRGYFSSLYKLAGYAQTVALAEEFLRDIGGIEVHIPSSEGALLQGMFFSSSDFLANESATYDKWREIFQRNPFLAKVFEVDFGGKNLQELLRLPSDAKSSCRSFKKGIVHCLGAGTIFEVNPQYVLQSLYRGVDHLAFNYRGIYKSIGSPSYEGTCEDAYYATKYLIDRLQCDSHQIAVIGTSMGGGPALFAAKQIPYIDVIVDRTFSRMSAVQISSCTQKFFSRIAEKFYTYPNEDWIGKIEGRVTVIHAQEDSLIDQTHAKRLIQAFREDHALMYDDINLIVASGGHASRFGGNQNYSWYADGRSQIKYSRALKGERIFDSLSS